MPGAGNQTSFPEQVKSWTLEENLLQSCITAFYILNLIFVASDKWSYLPSSKKPLLVGSRDLSYEKWRNQRKVQSDIHSNRLWRGQPQWVHIHYSSYIYGSGNITEERTEILKKTITTKKNKKKQNKKNRIPESLLWNIILEIMGTIVASTDMLTRKGETFAGFQH